MPVFRVIEDGAGGAAWNMGVDEALLSSAQAGQATLRFYRWTRPTLSVGHTQSVSAERVTACNAAGVELVRRVTGGRAVLHGSDLTYAIAAPEAAIPGDLRGSYLLISGALSKAFSELGLDTTTHTLAADREGVDFDCFAVPAAGEICVGGRKLCGHAQRRSRGALLQHASIRLTADHPAHAEAAGQIAGRATSLLECGVEVAPETLIEAFRRQLSGALGATFEASELLPGEAEYARQRVLRHAQNPLGSPLRND